MPCIARRLISANGYNVIRITGIDPAYGVNTNSNLWASVTEGDYWNPFVGAARIYVCSVAPGYNEAYVAVQIDWSQNLTVRISLFKE